jgi:DNA end-binding protein Ku
MALRANWNGHLKWSLVACARFDPSKCEDRYETALKELIAAKRAGKMPPIPPSPRPTNVVSLMDALRGSVEAERRGSSSESARSKAQKRAASRPTPLKRASAKRMHAS